jgi:primosomal protein N' (replication factor Y)
VSATGTTGGPRFARVVVDVAPAHLDRPFDYAVPPDLHVGVGQRVRVVFAGRRRPGWVVALADTTETDETKVRPLVALEGDDPWFDAADLRLYRWVADRYAATLADVLRHALPARVAAVEREGRPERTAPLPAAPAFAWDGYDAGALLDAVAARRRGTAPAFWLQVLPGDDPGALIEDLVRRCLAAGRSAVVLGADPGSGVPDRALQAAGAAGADLRVAAERARYRAFRRCRSGDARVAVGERGGVFAPVRDLGLVVVDDEANPAYKERRSPRHNAREVALARARMSGAVCVLVGDLPSANLWRLVRDGHVREVAVDRTVQRSRSARVDVVDLEDPRPGARRARFTELATRTLHEAVRNEGAAVVLASRGGQGSALVCRGCRRRLSCPVCSGSLAVARDEDRWRCPSCDWNGAPFACPDCGETRYAPLAAGAGRLAAELRKSHPAADVVRMEGFDAPGPRSRPALGVMTRGSVVSRPGWLGEDPADVVVVPDADALLLRPDYAAAEDALRLWMAVARWTSRMVVQTRDPASHAVQALVRWDAAGFWEAEAQRRAELRLPPAAALISLRCTDPATAAAIAGEVRAALPPVDEALGPDLDGTVLVKSDALRGTLAALKPLREDWAKHDRKVRVDVDPV